MNPATLQVCQGASFFFLVLSKHPAEQKFQKHFNFTGRLIKCPLYNTHTHTHTRSMSNSLGEFLVSMIESSDLNQYNNIQQQATGSATTADCELSFTK